MKVDGFGATVFTVFGLCLLVQAAAAGDREAGKKRYAVCVGCHGPSGAGNPMRKYPRLAGLTGDQVTAQLFAFREGRRSNPVMRTMAAGLTDTDIANLSAYIATLN